jgi:hypothetical protein
VGQINSCPIGQPAALSPDGRMLTFIRGPRRSSGPAGLPVEDASGWRPTADERYPSEDEAGVFPDGTRIAYTVVGPKFLWDTWVVPVLGSAPAMAEKRLRAGLDRSAAGDVREIKQSPTTRGLSRDERRIGSVMSPARA